MAWKLIGNLVLAFHAAWVVFNLIAPFWARRRPRLRVVHLGTMGLTLLFAAVLGHCPLTPLEYRLSGAVHGGGFIHRVLWELVYWDVSESWILGGSIVWFVLWAGIYARLWIRERR